MKPMIWHPEEKDQRINQYLAQINHAPYPLIFGIMAILMVLMVSFVLLGIF